MAYIVVADHPYYPQPEYCETLDEAKARRTYFLEDLAVPDGTCKCVITIAEVIETQTVRSHY